MKYERIDWRVSATMERIVTEMTFDNFEQSMRFMNVLIKFLQEEKAIAKAPQPPEATTSQDEDSQQGQIQSGPRLAVGADG